MSGPPVCLALMAVMTRSPATSLPLPTRRHAAVGKCLTPAVRSTAMNGAGKRETRLLLATIAVSAGMLLLLARFRFPDEASRQTTESAPAPLERLAARATYDELASVMADLERRISPSLFALGTQGDDGLRYLPAVRVTADRAVVMLPADRRLVSIGTTPGPPIVLRDPTTELVVVQTPPAEASVAVFPSGGSRPGLRGRCLPRG